MEFKSQVATSIEQSKRLLELGLKKETADCRHWAYIKDSKGNPIPRRNQKWFTRIGTDESAQVCGFMAATFIPAWSLHRMLVLLDMNINFDDFDLDNAYEVMIMWIADAIERGMFNHDYLEEK